MEPERKIEKLLRAFAKKRRADAGDAFKLHPATRRMLQGEVARHAQKAGGAGRSSSVWNWLRVRWALPLGFALLICLGVAVFWPAAPSKQDLAFNKAAAPAPAKELPAPVTPPIAGVNNSAPLPAPSAAPVMLDKPTTPAVATTELAYANPQANLLKDKTPAGTLFDETGADRARRQETTTGTNSTPPIATVAGNLASGSVTVLPPPAVAAPPASVPALAGAAGAATTANLALSVPPGGISGAAAEQLAPATSSRALPAAKVAPAASSAKFKSEAAMDSLQINAMKNSQRFVQAPVKKNLPVLASFEFQQNGNQISVVDRDGSIYQGTLQSVEQAEKTNSAKTQTTGKLGASQFQQKSFVAENSQQQTAQNYFFRVSGANRSLKQNVVFAGNLILLSNVTAKAAQNYFGGAGGGGGAGGQAKLADANVVQQQAFSNSRISGTVTIGRTNQMEINAMPAP